MDTYWEELRLIEERIDIINKLVVGVKYTPEQLEAFRFVGQKLVEEGNKLHQYLFVEQEIQKYQDMLQEENKSKKTIH